VKLSRFRAGLPHHRGERGDIASLQGEPSSPSFFLVLLAIGRIIGAQNLIPDAHRAGPDGRYRAGRQFPPMIRHSAIAGREAWRLPPPQA